MIDTSKITDMEIKKWLASPKTIVEKETMQMKNGMKKRNIKLKDNKNNFYQIYLRQNIQNKNDFSCGLSLELENKTYFTLVRCNGNSHIHTNSLEKEKLEYCFHIHLATEKYIKAGKKADGFAEKTDEYDTIEKACQFLLKKCNIGGDFFKYNLFGVELWK